MCSLPDLPRASEAPAGLWIGRKTRNPAESPALPYAVAFIDGQNLFHCARAAFGHTYPNYDPKKLASEVCRSRGWKLTQVRFYTGVPHQDRDAKWHDFWQKKSLRMRRNGVHVTTRPLRYMKELLDDGNYTYIAREKGIDVRIAIDVLMMAERQAYDVAVIFSQDQDLAELGMEIRTFAKRQSRWIKLASAVPIGRNTTNTRGINNTDWIRIERCVYDRCLEP